MTATPSRAKPPRSLAVYKTMLFLACVGILVVNWLSLPRHLDALQAENALQARSDRITDELQYLNLLVTDAESGLRGYFLSRSDTYLGPLRTAERELDPELGKLEALVADNPSQRTNLDHLRALVHAKMERMQHSLEVFRSDGLDEIVAEARSAEANSHMDEIRLQVVIMTGDQNELLAARSAAFYLQYRQALMVGIAINAAAIFVILLCYRLVRRSFRARLAAERALQRANDQLESTVAMRTEQLSVLSRHLIRVAEEEKARLARELHDELGANLTAIGMDVAAVGAKLEHDRPELAAMLARARKTLLDTVQLKRRIVEDLRPSLLDNLGLAAALHSYCQDYSHITGLDCEALVDGAVDGVAPAQTIALFRIAQEALNNAAKYAQARHVTVHLAREDDGLTLEVSDDGVGIAPDALARPKSHGLLGMRERALLLGGMLEVERGVNGKGTCVRAWIPAAAPPAAGRAGEGGAISAPHPSEGGHTPSSQPYSTLLRIPRDLHDQAQ
jgi:signal transduction histidine kinase